MLVGVLAVVKQASLDSHILTMSGQPVIPQNIKDQVAANTRFGPVPRMESKAPSVLRRARNARPSTTPPEYYTGSDDVKPMGEIRNSRILTSINKRKHDIVIKPLRDFGQTYL